MSDSLIPLLSAIALGNQQAFKSLYERTSTHLFGLCLRMLRRSDWAEEVLQESFIRVWHHASDYHPDKGSVMTWLISITRYRALDWLRRYRPSEPLSDELLNALPAEDSNPLEQFVCQLEQRRLADCMQELSPSQSQSIRLAFLHGLTHEQITEQLRVPLGTVKSWVRRGLQALNKCLEA